MAPGKRSRSAARQQRASTAGRLPLGLKTAPKVTNDDLRVLKNRALAAEGTGDEAKFYRMTDALEKLSACTPKRPYYFTCLELEGGGRLKIQLVRSKEGEYDTNDIVGDIAGEPADTPEGFQEAVEEGRWTSADDDHVQFRSNNGKHILIEGEIKTHCYFCPQKTGWQCHTCHTMMCPGCASGLTMHLKQTSGTDTPVKIRACMLAALRPMGFTVCGREGAPAALSLVIDKLDREAGHGISALDCIFCHLSHHPYLDDVQRPVLPLVISTLTREGIEMLPKLGLASSVFCAYEGTVFTVPHYQCAFQWWEEGAIEPDEEAMNNRFIGYRFMFWQRPDADFEDDGSSFDILKEEEPPAERHELEEVAREKLRHIDMMMNDPSALSLLANVSFFIASSSSSSSSSSSAPAGPAARGTAPMPEKAKACKVSLAKTCKAEGCPIPGPGTIKGRCQYMVTVKGVRGGKATERRCRRWIHGSCGPRQFWRYCMEHTAAIQKQQGALPIVTIRHGTRRAPWEQEEPDSD
eukprot:tig00000145_g8810.t1